MTQIYNIKNNKFIGSCFMSHPAFRSAATLIKSNAIQRCEDTKDSLGFDFGFEMTGYERSKNNTLRHNIHLSPLNSSKALLKDATIFDVVKSNIESLISYSNKVRCKFLGGQLDSKHWDLHIAVEQEPRMNNYIKLSKDNDRHGKS